VQVDAIVGLNADFRALLSDKLRGQSKVKFEADTHSLRYGAVQPESDLKVALDVNGRIHDRAVQDGKTQLERGRERSSDSLPSQVSIFPGSS
jgi:hypothetical protein